MRFAYLGSGSRGNAAVISAGATHVLLDCGFPASEAERRLQRLGLEAADLAAVLVTHEHGDHIGGVSALARRHGLAVYMTLGTRAAGKMHPAVDVRVIDGHSPLTIDALEVLPYPVPHDARQPCQFVFHDGQWRLGHLSNCQSAALLADIGAERLQHLVLAHLSEQNNSPALAQQAAATALAVDPDWVQLADQADGLDWRQLAMR